MAQTQSQTLRKTLDDVRWGLPKGHNSFFNGQRHLVARYFLRNSGEKDAGGNEIYDEYWFETWRPKDFEKQE
ncbi:MAG: hypothetical protein JW889_02070 [Verrucomicrobia bacterium]|nr:hypothetical protein [Verrucomicrobiota bacterium]